MYNQGRASSAYIQGVSDFLRAAGDHRLQRTDNRVPCPCLDCRNLKNYERLEQIERHLIMRGFMEGYECWSQHGEQESIVGGDDEDETMEEDAIYDVEPTDTLPATDFSYEQESEDQEDMPVEEEDRLHQMLEDFEEEYTDPRKLDKYLGMKKDAEIPMYPNFKAKYTKLATVLELLQMKEKHMWSDRSVTALLTFYRTFFLKETICHKPRTKLSG